MSDDAVSMVRLDGVGLTALLVEGCRLPLRDRHG
jgi:hypothetical protein